LVEDTIAIAALYRTLMRHLFVNPARNADIDAVGRAIVVENKWRAQRYGVFGTFVGADGAISVEEMLEQVIADTAEDAAALDCAAEIDRCRTIAGAGTSADAQLAVFECYKDDDPEAALRAVIDWIAKATLQ
jgi:carboxylate-amine ligase